MQRKRIIRVFPRRTNATPLDPDARIDEAPLLFDLASPPDEVHISVAFTYDVDRATWLARQWEPLAPVKIGGPGVGTRGEQFEPGLYVRKGFTMTSRGCNNDCWFCLVPRRDGPIRELPIRDGWNILDDNLLACTDGHVRAVFEMLGCQGRPVAFTGGLEAAILEDWHVAHLAKLRVDQMFFAYDLAGDLEPLQVAGKKLIAAGFTPCRKLRVYVLCGYPRDTITDAERRMNESIAAGFMPMAMVYRNKAGTRGREWIRFQKAWSRPAIMRKIIRERWGAV